MTGFPSRQARSAPTAPRRTAAILAALCLLLPACSASRHRGKVDARAYDIIEEKQRSAFNRVEPFTAESPADTLRRRLLLSQRLPYTGEASLGSDRLPAMPRWPEPRKASTADDRATASPDEPVLTLNDALQVAARNSRDYQSQKEQVFQSALDLDLERDQFRTSFAGLVSGFFKHNRSGRNEAGGSVAESAGVDATTAASRDFKNGMAFSLRLGWNLVQLLEPENFASRSMFGDASVSIPLLRGAGRHIAAESLTQAERNVVYQVYEFEGFKRDFAVRVADAYLSVLQSFDQVKNAEENYRGLIASTRRARRLLDAGNLPPIQVDQAMQDELDARNRWISARESQTATLDAFKSLLGLPVDARVSLDRAESAKLAGFARSMTASAMNPEREEVIPPADATIILEEPSRNGAGPFEIEPESAIQVALDNRLDLRIAVGRVFDAQRGVVVAADRLRPELTLFGRAQIPADRVSKLRFDRGDYEALLSLDLPFERTVEAIAYRGSYLRLEQAVRGVQGLEDAIKQDVRERLRNLREARESLRIQAVSVDLARRRVRGADLNLQAGRVQIRDLLEAQEDLLSAQNALTGAAVDYRMAELELQRDLGVLEVGADGLWTELNPQSLQREHSDN